MRKILVILIVAAVFICCRHTAVKGLASTPEDDTIETDGIEGKLLEQGSAPLIFSFDSAQVLLPSVPYIPSDPAFTFHFQSPEGGKITHTTLISGRRYEASISKEFSIGAFKALDSIFVQKSVPIVLSKKEASYYGIGYTPPVIIFKIYRDGKEIVNEKITLLCEYDGWEMEYSPLFDRFTDDLYNIKEGMLEYWSKFKANSE